MSTFNKKEQEGLLSTFNKKGQGGGLLSSFNKIGQVILFNTVYKKVQEGSIEYIYLESTFVEFTGIIKYKMIFLLEKQVFPEDSVNQTFTLIGKHFLKHQK